MKNFFLMVIVNNLIFNFCFATSDVEVEKWSKNFLSHISTVDQQKNQLIYSSKGKDIVAFIGPTGSGKSTLINYLAGKELWVNGSECIYLKNPKDGDMLIGDENSETRFPKYLEHDKNLFVDLPGFFATSEKYDKDKAIDRLLDAAFIRLVLTQANTVKFVLTIERAFATAARSEPNNSFLENFKEMGAEKVKSSILVLTKTHCIDAVDKKIKGFKDWVTDERFARFSYAENRERSENGEILDIKLKNQDERTLILKLINKIPGVGVKLTDFSLIDNLFKEDPSVSKFLKDVFEKVMNDQLEIETKIKDSEKQKIVSLHKKIEELNGSEFWNRFFEKIENSILEVKILRFCGTKNYDANKKVFKEEKLLSNRVRELKIILKESEDEIKVKLGEKLDELIEEFENENEYCFLSLSEIVNDEFYVQCRNFNINEEYREFLEETRLKCINKMLQKKFQNSIKEKMEKYFLNKNLDDCSKLEEYLQHLKGFNKRCFSEEMDPKNHNFLDTKKEECNLFIDKIRLRIEEVELKINQNKLKMQNIIKNIIEEYENESEIEKESFITQLNRYPNDYTQNLENFLKDLYYKKQEKIEKQLTDNKLFCYFTEEIKLDFEKKSWNCAKTHFNDFWTKTGLKYSEIVTSQRFQEIQRFQEMQQLQTNSCQNPPRNLLQTFPSSVPLYNFQPLFNQRQEQRVYSVNYSSVSTKSDVDALPVSNHQSSQQRQQTRGQFSSGTLSAAAQPAQLAAAQSDVDALPVSNQQSSQQGQQTRGQFSSGTLSVAAQPIYQQNLVGNVSKSFSTDNFMALLNFLQKQKKMTKKAIIAIAGSFTDSNQTRVFDKLEKELEQGRWNTIVSNLQLSNREIWDEFCRN